MTSDSDSAKTSYAAEAIEDSTFRYDASEMVGVFESEPALQECIDQLLLQGFDRSQLSVMGNSDTLRQSVASFEDDPDAAQAVQMSSSVRSELTAASVGLPIYLVGVGSYVIVVATGGTMAVALAALLLGGAAGGSLGGVLAHTIAKRHQDKVHEQLKAGGLVLWVNVRDDAQKETAKKVMEAGGASDVHLHQIAREWGIKEVPFYQAQPDPFLQNDHRAR